MTFLPNLTTADIAPHLETTSLEPHLAVMRAEIKASEGTPRRRENSWSPKGICIRLGQPEYDQFRLAEGLERLFPSVTDEQAHAFVAIVAASVCHS